MGKRMDSLVFPGGKSKAFTLSYDDGVTQDRRLAELLRKRGLKATFNISSGLFGHIQSDSTPDGRSVNVSKLPADALETVYVGHEIAGHGLFHSNLESIGTPLAMYEISEDKRRLEVLTNKPLKIFAYPFGTHNTETEKIVMLAGYQWARTVNATHSFAIPENFLIWNPTCHHTDPALMELAQQFLALPSYNPSLFYVWGHAYEFDRDDNWQIIETLADFLSANRNDIWFASNGEILDYVLAYHRLEYSIDGSLIYNPTALDVNIRTSLFDVQTIPSGRCVSIAQTPL